MSIKKLFDKGKTSQVVTSTDLQSLSEDAESAENIKQRFEDVNRFVPTVDFSNPENFARFGSAEKYYTDAMDRIVRYYPYDGSEAELNEYQNESSYIDRYVFDNLYPRTTGYANFSPHDSTNDNGGWGANDTNPLAANQYYGEPTTKEYIEVRGGPHTGSNGMLSGALGISFTGSNYYSTDIYNQSGHSPVGRDGTRESNLRMNLDDGITVEFWLKKESFVAAKTQKEVIFDLWNQTTGSNASHGRFRVELTASGFAEDGANPFRLTLVSGAVANGLVAGDGFQNMPLGGTTITTASIADNKWHHYAFSVVNGVDENVVRFYRDGHLVDTVRTGSATTGEITGSLIGYIGALQTHPNLPVGSSIPADSMVGWGKLSGSIDEFRYWKARRTSEQIKENYFTQVRGGTNTDVANTELGVYFKFNEGITGDATLDSTVLDYSGRISNGIWTGYAADARSTGSAILEYSGSTKTEYKDPIIYPTHPDVQYLRTNLIASSSFHDVRNNSSIFQSLPSWMIEEDDETGGQLKNLTQIVGNYFDTLFLQIEAMKDLHVPTYQTSSGKALPFANRLLESKGFINSEIFANAEVLEAVMNRDTEREYSDDLHNVKNLIYQNIYNNLVHIFKTKGTEKSFQNLIRSFGVDEELIRINLYADNTTQLLRDNFRPKAAKKNFVDFYQTDNQDAVVTHDVLPSTTSTIKNPDAVGVTYISASHKDFSTTAESEVIFPRLKDPGDPGFIELSFTDSSIFGWDQADADPDDFIKPSGGSGYQVLAIRPDLESKDAFFKLVDRSNNLTIATSSLFKDVYEDNRWVFALRTRNALTSSITPTSPAVSHGMGTFLTGAIGVRAKATITVIDSSSPPGVPFIGEGDTIELISTDGTTVTLTMQGTGGSTTSSETSGTTLTAKTLSAGSYASSTLHATAQAVEIRTAINHHTKFSATNTANVISIVQAEAGASGNTTLTITELGATGMSNTNFVGGANANRVEVSLYGVHTAYDRIQEEFALSGTAIHSDITVPRRYYVGARRTNVTGGTVNEKSSVKVGYLRHWQMYLDNHVIQAHARDTENYGTFNPLRSTYLLENPLTGTYLPEIQTLAFNWDFSNVTASDASGEFTLQDFSSGSLLKRRFRDPDIDPIVNNQYNARGYFFKTSTTAAVDTNYISSARYRLPEVMNSHDMIDIRTQDDLTFTKESRPISHFFAFEKSMYQAISEEMINMFAGINEFNNLIGEPVNRYRHEYKDMSKLRQIFYENVENTPDLDKYLSYYKWLDTALGEMLQQLVPASSRFSDDVRNMVEDTALTRNKYRHILPTLRTPNTVIEGQIKGIEEHLYNWKIGHAPMNNTGTKVVHPQPEDKHCLWWRQRAERQGASVTSDRASVDRSAAQVAIIDEQRNIYKRKGYSYISASVPQFAALQGTDGVTKVGVNNVPIYTGSYYPNNRFSRVYRLFMGVGFNSLSIIGAWNGYLIAGHNPVTGPNTKYTYWRTTVDPADTTKLIEVSSIIDESGCEYAAALLPSPGTFPSKDLRPGGVVSLSATTTAGSLAGKANNLPFSLYKSDVTTGYKASISNVNIKTTTGATVAGGLELNNLHQDIIETGEASMQGPFTEKYVGGLPHRHVDINTKKGGNFDDPTTRVEGFVVVPSANTIQVRAPSAASDDRGSSSPEVRGDFYRNTKVKRPVNVANIRQLTGSSQLNHIGNFTSFREIVQISDRDANNRSFVKHEGKGPFLENSRAKRKRRGNVNLLTNNLFHRLGEFKDVAKPNFYISGSSHRENDIISLGGNQFAESNTTDYIFVERFSAPGGPETAGDSMGGAALDFGSAQYSPYNNLNYRNLTVRLPLHRLLTEHANQFGFSSEPDALKATATITVTVANVDNIGQGDTIELTATNGKTITCTLQGVGGTTTSTATDGNVQAATFASGTDNTLQATSQAVAIATAINSNNFFTATNNANVVTVTQAVGGGVGNTAITITELGATGLTKTDFQGGAGRASTVNSFDYRGIPAFHDVNRNSRLRFEFSSSRQTAETVIRKKTHDNFFVQREIPQSETQYAWITASLTHIPGHQTTVLGHPHPDGTVSSSVAFDYGLAQGANTAIASTTKTVGPGFIPALNFVSASDVVSKIGGGVRRWLGPGGNVSHNTNGGADKRAVNSTFPNGFLPTDFVGMNGNVRQVINTGSLILSGAAHAFHNDLPQIGTAPFYRASHLYINSIEGSDTGEFTQITSEPRKGDTTVLNALNLNRNGPYGYPSFKQIRTGETRIGRYLRRNNIISFNETPGRHLVSEDAGRGREEKIERFGTLKQFREPVAVSRHKPAKFMVGMKETYEDSGRTVTKTRPVMIEATYGNDLGFFSDRELDDAKGFVKPKPVGYRTVGDFYLRGGLESPATPVESFIDFRYADTVYPKEKNTYMLKSRSRNAFANNFWRNNPLDRLELGQSKVRFNGTTPDDLDAASGEAFTPKQTKLSSWSLDGPPIGQFTTASVSVFNVLTGSEVGILQHRSAILHYGNKHTMTASVIYARPHLLEATASVRSPVGPSAPSSSASMILAGKPLGRMKIFGGITAWEAGENAGVVNDDGVFVKRPTTPFYDSYDDFAEDLRVVAKDYSIVPEFRISEHMDFYIKEKQGNFLADNPKLLSIFGSPTGSTVPQNSSENDFFTVYSNTDFMKHFAEVKEEHKEIAKPSEITLTCKAAMKFLPYNGFYPAERTVDIATQFSKSYGDQVSFTGDDSVFSSARIRPLVAPLFAPGIMYNSIKSGIAVDYPVYTSSFKRHNPKDAGDSNVATNYIMMSTASSPRLDAGGKLAGWDFRVPFETIIEPKRFITNLSFVDMEVHPSSAMDMTASWDGQGDELYERMSNNFFAAVPEFFLPAGEFSTLKSKPSKQFKSLDTGSVYGLRIKLRKSYNRGRQPGRLNQYIVPNDTFLDFNSTTEGKPSLRETFTMYSRPSAFGPPMSGRDQLGATGSAALEQNTFSRQLLPDSLLGMNPSFTPPYYDGEAWCDVLFRPSSSFATLGDILAGSRKLYWRFDKLGLGTQPGANTQPYGQININRFAMQLSSSFNLFQRVQEPNVTFDADGNPITIGESSDDKSVWVIQPKFETPMFNFNDQFGVNPIVAGTNFTVPTNNSESVTRGIWHQFGVFPTDPQQGIFLDIEDIPQNFLINRVKNYGSSSFFNNNNGHRIDENAANIDDTNIKGFYGGSGTNRVPFKSLLDVVQFDKKTMRLGETAQKLTASEAVVAVPFIEEGGQRKFFNVDKTLVDKVIANPRTEEVGESIKHMVNSLDKYVVPPTMDFVAFRDRVDPIAMYFFEFEFEFDKNDLSHMWQNLMPPSGKIVKKSETKVGHKLVLNELLGNVAGETGESIDDRLQWMVFKVKQRANTNYFSKVAGANTDADPRFRKEFKAGRASEETTVQDRFSFNWPFDFFSMVELIKLESEIKFSAPDKDIDERLVIKSDKDTVDSGVKAAPESATTTSLLPSKE
jgi:hypothetical protein